MLYDECFQGSFFFGLYPINLPWPVFALLWPGKVDSKLKLSSGHLQK